MHLHQFHYDLPPELLARYPSKERAASRLMLVKHDQVEHHHFKSLPLLLQPNDLLVFNNSKVIPARLRAKKTSGGAVELLLERIINPQQFLAHSKTSKPLKPGTKIICGDYILTVSDAILTKTQHKLLTINLEPDLTVSTLLDSMGELPLPPYFKRAPTTLDYERYQTVYASNPGSVAAPTAGLHFDHELMTELKNSKINLAFLTLHVGAGTFLPVRTADITQHQLHAEYLTVTPEVCAQVIASKQCGGRVIAVGTTSARALETAAQDGVIKPYQGESSLFIYPGYQFNCIDALITNFHLPESSLLMLVCALGGYQAVMAAYNLAIDLKYRFYSYGDAMIVYKNNA